jgi:hypothetical protein
VLGLPIRVGSLHAWVAVWAVMNLVVIPLSRIAPSPFSFSLFVNGVVGHAIFVGIPIAYAARRYLGEPEAPLVARRAVEGAAPNFFRSPSDVHLQFAGRRPPFARLEELLQAEEKGRPLRAAVVHELDGLGPPGVLE